MENLKKYLLCLAVFAIVSLGTGCTDIRQLVKKANPTNTPTPTPTRSVDLWYTATPTLSPATPTLKPATPTPTVAIYVPATATPTPPFIQVTATPTPVQTVATPTPKADATATPTKAPTKAPTKTPTPKPAGSATASSLMNLLYNAYPDLMSTTSIKVDLVETNNDGSVSNMYYTKYTNEESQGDNLHAQHDIWVTSIKQDNYSCDEVYTVFGSSDITTYTNTGENSSKWTKKKLAKDSLNKGVTIVPKGSFISLSNPKIISSSRTGGYEVQMDCVVDLTDIVKTLTDGSYTKRISKTFKATAIFDYTTQQPISFNAEGEDITITSSLKLNYFQMLVDNIMDTSIDIDVPDDVLRNAR